jgi:soluble lytic murein transglycosylase-like protein
MTADLNSGGKRAPDPDQRRNFGFVLAIILASLASGAVAVFSASGGRPAGWNSSAALPEALTSNEARPSAILSRSAKYLRTDLEEANVEALIDAAARRYRISIQAMRDLVDTAYAEARRNRLDPLLIIAVMAVESRFNPIAQSDAGATGLMQVIPHYHSDKFSVANGETVLDPRINIKVGAQVLREYIVRGGSEAAGLQLYNGASGDASNAYANRVLAERARLQVAVRRAREPMVAGLRAMG